MISLDVTIDLSTLLGELARVEASLSVPSLAAFLGTSGNRVLQERAVTRFADEGDSASGAWQELAFPTRQIRASQGFPPEHPINVRTGELQSWVTTNHGQVSTSAQLARLLWPGDPPNTELAAKFQTAQKGRGNPPTPPRPVAAADATDLELLMTAMAQWVEAGTGLRFA